ncbi:MULTISPECIES: hypothetical protein [Psychrobacter]|uniref:hypothetical protein n=1 Tax=Psychrobacter TaxID=497 RepID=UPI000EC034E6|nr:MULTISPECIES: hypothetical protein [Psychrobacter]MBE8610338.1 hypothetical protein [Pseudomonas lundensis]MDA5134600.1 hypothetical protein [Psychrobacter sp. ANT_H3]NRD71520.1 hypothetical protein [Psychrobacter okhotskensis]HCI76909.1 hypothetical protein [Psychrobacter sp.]
MIANVFNSIADSFFNFLLAIICVLMLLAPLYKWKSRPNKALTKRIIIAIFLIPVSLYLLVDTFNTKDQQKNDQLLSVAHLSERDRPLENENHISMPDKHAFAATLELNGIRTKQNNESRTNLKENKDEHQEGSSQVSLHSENNNGGL